MERRFMRLFFSLGSFFAWVPEVLSLGRERFRSQVRLLGLAALVGIVAGLGAIVFYVSTRIVEHYALGVVAGYYPEPHPGGEPSMSWLPVIGTSPLSVALADHTDSGRTVERRACLHVRTRSRRTRHGFRHCGLPLSPGANPPPCAAGEDRCQCVDPRQRRIGRKGRPHRSNWSGLWLVARQPAAFTSCGTPGADGRWNGSGHRRHFSGTACRDDLRRRSDVQFPGV